MFKAVLLQCVATLVVALAAWLMAGSRGGFSALLGGGAVIGPNLLFAVRLWLAARAGRASVGGFVVGEFLKVAAILALLVTVAVAYRDLHWLAMLAGLFVALKASLILIFVRV